MNSQQSYWQNCAGAALLRKSISIKKPANLQKTNQEKKETKTYDTLINENILKVTLLQE